MNAYLTVEALAPLEDVLVEEITEHERGECESSHRVTGRESCTHAAISLSQVECAGRPKLACAVATQHTAAGIASGRRCSGCKRTASECWSVVMLP